MTVHREQGFTLIELLMVLALSLLALTVSVSGIRNYAAYQQYNQAVNDVRTALQKTRNDARHTVDGSGHGVYITSTDLTYYTGTSYSPSDPSNITVSYPNVTFVSGLTSGAADLVFAPLTGYVNASGTITVIGTGPHQATTTIVVAGSGVIE